MEDIVTGGERLVESVKLWWRAQTHIYNARMKSSQRMKHALISNMVPLHGHLLKKTPKSES